MRGAKEGEREIEREPLARKPVAPVTKIVLFAKNWSISSDSMRGKKKWERERVNDDDLKQEVDDF